MRLNIHLDFDNTYPRKNISEDLSKFQFTCYDIDGHAVELHVHIVNNDSVFLPSVWNLSFGPMSSGGEVDDMAVIKHQDSFRVYSTILLGALMFLRANPGSRLGIDGSNLTRAYLYYKLLQINHDYLSRYVNSLGVKYYIRLLRGRDKYDVFIPDQDDIAIFPFKIPKNHPVKAIKMFNYFVLDLIDNI